MMGHHMKIQIQKAGSLTGVLAFGAVHRIGRRVENIAVPQRYRTAADGVNERTAGYIDNPMIWQHHIPDTGGLRGMKLAEGGST